MTFQTDKIVIEKLIQMETRVVQAQGGPRRIITIYFPIQTVPHLSDKIRIFGMGWVRSITVNTSL